MVILSVIGDTMVFTGMFIFCDVSLCNLLWTKLIFWESFGKITIWTDINIY